MSETAQGINELDSSVSKPDAPLKLLIIGPLPPPYGGTTVSFKHLLDHLRQNKEIVVTYLDTCGVRGRGVGGLLRLVALARQITITGRRVQVIALHCSTTALPTFGLMVLVAARLLRRPLVIRQFGGADYLELGRVKSRIAHFVVSHVAVYLLQTKCQLQQAKDRGIGHVEWYPTSRPMELSLPPPSEPTCSQFVFLGHVNDAKGVRDILKIDSRLDDPVTIDVYGPFTGTITANDFSDCKHVFYRGVIQPDEAIATLSKYHALVFPTHYHGEGYPGVIIEAYAAGLPVICTHWMALPEIVDDSSGILIPAHDSEALLNAIRYLHDNPAEFLRLHRGALQKRREFSLEHWATQFVAICKQAAFVP